MADEARRLVRGLAVFVGAHGRRSTCCRVLVMCAPDSTPRLYRVEFMARHVPSQAGNETSEDFETLFVSTVIPMLHVSMHNSHRVQYTPHYTHDSGRIH